MTNTNTDQTQATTKHTPGPWRAPLAGIYAPDGAMVASVGSRDIIANQRKTLPRQRNVYEVDANARLIAAAPELLSALQAIKARLCGAWDHPVLLARGELSTATEADVLGYANAAIAKATGGGA